MYVNPVVSGASASKKSTALSLGRLLGDKLFRGRKVSIEGGMNKKSVLETTVASDLLPHLRQLLNSKIDRIIIGNGISKGDLDSYFSSLDNLKKNAKIRDVSALCFGEVERFLPNLEKYLEEAVAPEKSTPELLKILTRCAERCVQDTNGKAKIVKEKLMKIIEENVNTFAEYAVLGTDPAECRQKAASIYNELSQRFSYFKKDEVEMEYIDKLSSALVDKTKTHNKKWLQKQLANKIAKAYEESTSVEEIKEAAQDYLTTYILKGIPTYEVLDLFTRINDHDLNEKLLDALFRLVKLEIKLESFEGKAVEETTEIIQALIKAYPAKIDYRTRLAEFYKIANATELVIVAYEDALIQAEKEESFQKRSSLCGFLLNKVREARRAHNLRLDAERQKRLKAVDEKKRKIFRSAWGQLKMGSLKRSKFDDLIKNEELFFDFLIEHIIKSIKGDKLIEGWEALDNLERLAEARYQKNKIRDLKKGITNKIVFKAIKGSYINPWEKRLALKQAENVGLIDHFVLMHVEAIEMSILLSKGTRSHSQIEFLRKIYKEAFGNYIDNATKFAEEGDFEKALEEAQKAKEAHPRNFSVEMTFGNIYLLKGNQSLMEASKLEGQEIVYKKLKQAIIDLERALEYSPNNLVVKQKICMCKMKMAETHANKGDKSQAAYIFFKQAELFQKEILDAEKFDEQNPGVRDFLGMVYNNLGYCLKRFYELTGYEDEKVLDRAQEALLISGRYYEECKTSMFYSLINIYAYKGEWEGMIEAALGYVERSNDFSANLAVLYQTEMMLRQSFAPYSKRYEEYLDITLQNLFSNDLIKEKAEQMFQIAEALISLGYFDQALKISDHYRGPDFSEKPAFVLGLLIKARVGLVKGEYDETLNLTLEALKLAHPLERAYFYSEYFNCSIALDAHALFVLSHILGSWATQGTFHGKGLQQLEESIEQVRESASQEIKNGVQKNTEYAVICHTLGVLKDFMGKTGEAEKNLKTAIEHRPDYPHPHLHLIELYRRSNHEKELENALLSMKVEMLKILSEEHYFEHPVLLNLGFYVTLIRIYARKKEKSFLHILKKVKERAPQALLAAITFLESEGLGVPPKIKTL